MRGEAKGKAIEHASATITQKREELIARRDKLVTAFGRAAAKGKPARLGSLHLQIVQVVELINTLEEIEAGTAAKMGRRRFVVSSLFLHESFKKLTADQDEQFFFVTGSEVDGALVLDQWAEFTHQKRTFVGVTADTASTHRLLIKLEQFGHRLLAHFHSHPGDGADSTRPSGTDENFQKRLEHAGHVAVMAIFSRDGYVRFLRLDRDFEIDVYGEGVEKSGDNIFHLKHLG